MERGRPKKPLVLSEEEKRTLESLARQRKAGVAEVTRARIVLGCAQGMTNKEVAREEGVSEPTVCTWRERFRLERLAGLGDLPRAGAPRTVEDEQVAQIVRRTLQTRPKSATHWSTRTMAREAGVSHQTISRIWQAFGLHPHRHESFTLSTDPLFVEKVRDVVGLYQSPPQNAVVFCVDEKSQIQALERSQPILPMDLGRAERHTHDYFRHGTVSLFAALEVATGEVWGRCHARHTHKEFLAFLKQIEDRTPAGLDIHAVLDNYATHKTDAVVRWLARHPRWHLHFIPTHSSWLNQVERFFAELTRKRLQRESFLSVQQLRSAISDYLKTHNQNPRPFLWTASADIILGKVAHLCKKLQ
ncbi:IS630 family transposase [Opitutaceae bacterium TAV4]|nr:IS630 family transposase [Opitutaceae bacterium TAV4]RRJ99519.1 IS630 family transposase [Opitutaceae bacterium TAV3]RRJ96408.1 IS630 family transposase [Opitutaceae bacterium TAV4]RRJ96976.1 IS630 family transposase [Opitutaceae bacterium TAV4]RRJ98048.1 IS630 family transposase [Opitutaceae bacterium TAV4]